MFVVLFRASPHFQSCRDDVQFWYSELLFFSNLSSRWEGSLCSLSSLSLISAQLTSVGVKFFIQLIKTAF